MLDTPFLTDLDARAAVKGSRDPLGIQQLWTRFGRRVVGNLTTVSNSVRDFTTLLLGYHFAEELSEDLGPGTELETFLKWEQLAAYARGSVNADWRFRGTERVRRNLTEGKRVTVSADRGDEILGNQKIYGLWGLYTVPARASGLLDGDPPRLTLPARELVDTGYLPVLAEGAGRHAHRIRDLLRNKSSQVEVRGKHSQLVKAIGKALSVQLRPLERAVFRTHLLYGGPDDQTEGRQQQMAELLTETLAQADYVWSPASMAHLNKSALSKGEGWSSLGDCLDRIWTTESVFAPASALFSHLLGLDGKSVTSVSKRLKDEWGGSVRSARASEFRDLRAQIAAGDEATGDRWVGIAESLATGRYGDLIELLIEQNKTVMAARGGASWIDKPRGTLQVRFRDEQGKLPGGKELPELWRFSYFLDSLRTVADALRGD